jgi:hypothetical protein
MLSNCCNLVAAALYAIFCNLIRVPQRYVERKMDCNLHIGVYPPLTVAGKFNVLEAQNWRENVGGCSLILLLVERLGFDALRFCCLTCDGCNLALQLPGASLKCVGF